MSTWLFILNPACTVPIDVTFIRTTAPTVSCFLVDQHVMQFATFCDTFNASWWAINKSNCFLGQMQTGGLPPFSGALAFNNTPSCEMASWLADKLKCAQEHLSGFQRLWTCLKVINMRLFPPFPPFLAHLCKLNLVVERLIAYCEI